MDDFPPNTSPYEQLAPLWNDFVLPMEPNYGKLLASVGKSHNFSIKSALDLACGTGRITRQLASCVPKVVGLDQSEAMLKVAKAQGKHSTIEYFQGDFRNFILDQKFDGIMCIGDSINYLDCPEELVDVCRSASKHLLPGGFFIFDAFDHAHFLNAARKVTVAEVRKQPFEIYFFYDPGSRISEARVVIGDIIERHRRIPIEAGQVRSAASAVGLEIVERFSIGTKLRLFWMSGRQVYVLRKHP